MIEDTELLHRYAENPSDEEPFSELVRRRLDLVYSAALRQVGGDSHRAQDVAQLVFCELAQKADSLSRHPALDGWLYTATRFTVINMMRTEKARQRREQEVYAMNDIDSSASGSTDWGQLRPVIDETMHELDEHERQAILLRFFDKAPLTVVGAKLGLSENAAQKKVDRTLDKLRDRLARKGITSTSVALAIALADQTVVAAPSGLAAVIAGAAVAGSNLGGVGAASTAGILTLMFSGKNIVLIALVIAALGWASHESSQAKTAAAALGSIGTRTADRVPHQETAASPDELAAKIAQLSNQVAGDREAIDAIARERERRIAANPSYLPGFGTASNNDRIVIDRGKRAYAEFLSQLNDRSPEEINAIAAALVGIMPDGSRYDNLQNPAGRAVAEQLGLSPQSNPEFYSLVSAAADVEAQNNIRSILGDDDYARFFAWDTGPGIPSKYVGVELSYIAHPILDPKRVDFPPDQEAKLRELLMTSVPPDGMSDGAPIKFATNGRLTITPAMEEKAATFLGPEQLVRLHTVVESQIAVRKDRADAADSRKEVVRNLGAEGWIR